MNNLDNFITTMFLCSGFLLVKDTDHSENTGEMQDHFGLTGHFLAQTHATPPCFPLKSSACHRIAPELDINLESCWYAPENILFN